MKKNILERWLIGLTFVAGFLSFFSVYRAIKISDASTWLVPSIFISLFVVLLLTLTIFARHIIEIEIIALLSLMTSIFFAFNFWHFVILLVFGFLALSALADIRNDLDLNVKISLWKTLYSGKFKLIFALAIIICSQYFFTIKNMNGQIKIPKIDVSTISLKVAKPILGEINPGYKTITNENLTVDQYILESQNKSGADQVFNLDLSQDDGVIDAQIPKDLPQDQQDAIKQQAFQARSAAQLQLTEKNKELILQEGRQQLSQIFGQQLGGNEMMSDVIVSPVIATINNYFQLNINGNNQSSVFPWILVAVLFFTLWPLGSLLSVVWFLMVILIFQLILRLEIVQIEKITVEREMIA